MAYFAIEGYNSYSGCDITVTASLPPINGKAINKYYTLGSLQTLSISTHQDKRPVRSLGVINAKDYVMGPRTIAGSMVFAVFNKHFATEIMNDLGAGAGYDVVLPDEIPALNITVNFANEYGRMSRMAIYGVKIINEGQVMSINDLYTENTYQFVALGLEPLNVNISESGEPTSPKTDPKIYGGDPVIKVDPVTGEQIIINTPKERGVLYGYSGKDLVVLDTTNSTDSLLKNKNFLENSGSNISEQIQNNTKINTNSALNSEITDKFNPITLSVNVEHPRGVNDSGYATFILNPEQYQGIIYVYPIDNKNNIEYTLFLDNKKNLILTLPVGNYQAQYVNSNSETSNTVYFSIDKYIETQVVEHINNYPVIEKVSNDYIIISNTNYSHNTLVYFEEGNKFNTVILNKNTTRIENLKPNTEYKIYTTNDNAINNSRSQIITVKTYEHKDQEVTMLNDFINLNKDLLVEIDTSNLSGDNIDKYNSIIDMVLDLPESIEKQETLIYAVELANQLTSSHNRDNTNHIINDLKDDPFSTEIFLTDYDTINIYNNNNGRRTFNTSLKKSENEIFYAKPNKHYSLCGVSESGEKSVKVDIAPCKNSVSLDLENYRRTNLYKNIDLTEYLNKYKTFTYQTAEALAIKDNFYSEINILQPPYIYQQDNTIYANVDYLNLNRYSTYYLCCAELYSALDYLPKRKIPFTLDNASIPINLKDHYLGLNPNKKYLFWIENSDFIKISKPFLFIYDTFEEYKEIKYLYKQDLYSRLLNIKKDLLRVYGNVPVINDVFNFVISLEPSQKDLDITLISEMINNVKISYYVHDAMIPLYELLKIIHTYSTGLKIPEIELDRVNRTIEIKNSNYYTICAIDFSENNQNLGERLVEYENKVNYGKTGYTLFYLMSSDMVYKSGFIFIDNEKNVYKCTEDICDYIKEVGDK